ncbi:hypothetical protein PHMEG_0007016 [Phytophthora megakarya]|uniref:Uncharacterized protein n=1 Tax=Phytophthora megakarya TaxID=4795 RepID=A0A225WPQ6_9STRA|nr:hypothetical protein PHMEG_0007016 [Phytophthora megakarya]
MEKQVYDLLYDACEAFILLKIAYRREMLAVTLDWLGRAATCRGQETKFTLAYSTVHCYRRVGLYAIIQALAGSIQMATNVPAGFVSAVP